TCRAGITCRQRSANHCLSIFPLSRISDQPHQTSRPPTPIRRISGPIARISGQA
ncbi:hypothetical protein Dimus_017497, partial [Dionaea muscipula]